VADVALVPGQSRQHLRRSRPGRGQVNDVVVLFDLSDVSDHAKWRPSYFYAVVHVFVSREGLWLRAPTPVRVVQQTRELDKHLI